MCEEFWYNTGTTENSVTYNVSSDGMNVWVYHNGNFDIEKKEKRFGKLCNFSWILPWICNSIVRFEILSMYNSIDQSTSKCQHCKNCFNCKKTTGMDVEMQKKKILAHLNY